MVTATTASTATYVTGNGVNSIDSLVLGSKWGAGGVGTAASVGYSFPGVGSQWHTDYQYNGHNEPGGIGALNAGQQTAFRTIVQGFAEIANITFTEITENNTPSGPVGDIRIAYSDALIPTTAAGWAYGPDTHPMSGDIWIEPTFNASTEGSTSMLVLAHELGHALGLAHPFDGSGFNGAVLPAATDTSQYTIMSYTNDLDYGSYYPSSPQLYDIAALHYLYGANMTTRTGNTDYSMLSGTIPQGVYCIWDAGGTDTLSAVGETVGATISLVDGTFSSIGKIFGAKAVNNISIAFGAVIENAEGSNYADTITGNTVANVLNGNGGNDTLNGGGGNDTLDGGSGNDVMSGGSGNDAYYVNAAGDTVVESASQGTDTVYVGFNYTLGANVENLIMTGASSLSGTGNTLNNTITGNDGANVLQGGAGNDVLNGGGGNDTLYGQAGTNTMTGGLGNDRYYVDNVGDTIIEGVGEGGDFVQSSVTFTLAANLENLTLSGSAVIDGTGNTLRNIVKGNNAANTLDGGDGHDVLIGRGGDDVLIGGLGNDRLLGQTGTNILSGGLGNDRYFVDSVTDTIIEGADEGGDLVQSSVTFTLAANVENLILSGSAAIDGTGNTLRNIVKGNDAANTLDGGDGNDTLIGRGGNDVIIGGLGNDRLFGQAGTNTVSGGLGNDRYYVDSATDVLNENVGEGVDLVQTWVTFTLGTNFENMLLAGSAAIDGTGNKGNNVIKGNNSDNTLRGGNGADALIGRGGDDILIGGDGNDRMFGQAGTNTMIGGAGNDRYYVDSITDTVTESVSNGIDRIYTTVDFTLTDNVENLIMTGAGAIDGTGNADANIITGNGGANVIKGSGGTDTLIGRGGADTLFGGSGVDVFQFDALADIGDVIRDFNAAGGEYLKVGTLLGSLGWGGGDAVAGGWLSLVQNGADVDVMLDVNGGGDALTEVVATLTTDTVAGLGSNWWLA